MSNLGLERVDLMRRELRRQLGGPLLGLGGLAFGFACLAALIHQGTQSRLVPYLVTVDRQGVVLAHGELQPSAEIPPQAIAAAACDFIRDLRLVTQDQSLQHRAILRAYSHLREGSAASAAVDAHYRDSNPFSAAESGSTEVRVTNVLLASERTLQVDWQETVRAGQAEVRRAYRGLLTFARGEPDQDPGRLLLNPLGIFFEELSVSEVIGDAQP
ncbi:MAG: hypothetical protein K6A65_08720 [Succinivibrionaceae bacterium]|nr:hypothetical protein [Succinivibrionaceae bacterium]